MLLELHSIWTISDEAEVSVEMKSKELFKHFLLLMKVHTQNLPDLAIKVWEDELSIKAMREMAKRRRKKLSRVVPIITFWALDSLFSWHFFQRWKRTDCQSCLVVSIQAVKVVVDQRASFSWLLPSNEAVARVYNKNLQVRWRREWRRERNDDNDEAGEVASRADSEGLTPKTSFCPSSSFFFKTFSYFPFVCSCSSLFFSLSLSLFRPRPPSKETLDACLCLLCDLHETNSKMKAEKEFKLKREKTNTRLKDERCFYFKCNHLFF